MAVQYNPAIVTDGLVLCLDAANLKSYQGSGVTWGNLIQTNTGILTNGASFNALNGGSIAFDGTNDLVLMSASEIFNFGTANFSIDCWFNVTGNSILNGVSRRDAAIFHIGTNAGFVTNCLLVLEGNSSTTGTAIQFYQNTPVETSITTTFTITQNVWHNVCIVKSSNNIIKYYDGNQVSQTANNTSWGSSTNIAKIGQLWSGTAFDDNLNGRVSNLKIYKRALNSSEVLQNFNALRGRFGI